MAGRITSLLGAGRNSFPNRPTTPAGAEHATHRRMQARTTRDQLRPQRVWVLRKGTHEAAIDLRAVAGVGAEIVLRVDGKSRKTRLFRSHEHAGTGPSHYQWI